MSGTNDGRTTSAAWTDGTDDSRRTVGRWTNDGRNSDGRRTDDTRHANGSRKQQIRKQVAASLSGTDPARRTRNSTGGCGSTTSSCKQERQGRPDWIGATEQLTRLGLTGRKWYTPQTSRTSAKFGNGWFGIDSALAKSRRPVTSVLPARSAPPPLPSPYLHSRARCV